MKRSLLVCLLMNCLFLWAQPRQSFDTLKKSKLPHSGIEFWYDPNTTILYDVAVKNAPKALKEEIKYYDDGEYYGNNGYVVAKIMLTPKDECYVVYIDSWDEGFRFCRPKSDKELGALWPHGLLVVPGNGTLYTRDHRNNFRVSRKYQFANDTITEVQQPLLYVGLKTRTLKSVKIYDCKEKKNLIAILSPNYEIEILLTESDYIIAKTKCTFF